MRSKWDLVRPNAIALRKEGKPVKFISEELGIPGPTLSHWFKNVFLDTQATKTLLENQNILREGARIRARESHTNLRLERIAEAHRAADQIMADLPTDTKAFTEIALAFLYLGEGAKAEKGLRLGNSNPQIVLFYISAIEQLYGISRDKLRPSLHLRADQSEEDMKKFWSEALSIPIGSFGYVIKDKRTLGRPTYKGYYGVCLIEHGQVAIQRKLLYLADTFCKRTITSAVSSAG